MGDILSTVRGYLEYCGGCHEYHGGYRVPWGVFSTMGGIMSTMEGVQYRGVLLFEYPMVLNTPTVLMISPHGSEHPHGTAHTSYRMIC